MVSIAIGMRLSPDGVEVCSDPTVATRCHYRGGRQVVWPPRRPCAGILPTGDTRQFPSPFAQVGLVSLTTPTVLVLADGRGMTDEQGRILRKE